MNFLSSNGTVGFVSPHPDSVDLVPRASRSRVEMLGDSHIQPPDSVPLPASILQLPVPSCRCLFHPDCILRCSAPARRRRCPADSGREARRPALVGGPILPDERGTMQARAADFANELHRNKRIHGAEETRQCVKQFHLNNTSKSWHKSGLV